MFRFKIWAQTSEFLSLNEVRPAPLFDLYTYWSDCCSGDAPPAQQDMSLDMVRESLGNIALIDLERNPAGARYLLVGSALKKLLGKDPTGKLVDQVYSQSIAREVYEAFGRAVRDRQASFYQRDFEILGRSFGYYRLILPLRLGKEEAVRRILIGIYPTDRRLIESKQWRSVVDDMENERLQEDRLSNDWRASMEADISKQDGMDS